MKKLLVSICSFAVKRVEVIAVGLAGIVLGALGGVGLTRKYYEKKLMKTKEALRKCYAKMSALDASEKKNAQKIRQCQAQIAKYQEIIQDLEGKLGHEKARC